MHFASTTSRALCLHERSPGRLSGAVNANWLVQVSHKRNVSRPVMIPTSLLLSSSQQFDSPQNRYAWSGLLTHATWWLAGRSAGRSLRRTPVRFLHAANFFRARRLNGHVLWIKPMLPSPGQRQLPRASAGVHRRRKLLGIFRRIVSPTACAEIGSIPAKRWSEREQGGRRQTSGLL